MDSDNLFDFVSDMDLDGDIDLEDYLIEEDEFDKLMDEEDKRGEPTSSDDWQEDAEDGFMCGPDLYDYETEEKYEEDLREAKEDDADAFPFEESDTYED